MARSLLKAPKYYFYDIAQTRNSAARLENLIACALLKEIHFREDAKGKRYELFYLRNKDKKEVDFFVTLDREPALMAEVKKSQETVSDSLKALRKNFQNIKAVQLVQNLKREQTFSNGIEIRKAAKWLSNMKF